MMAAMVAVLPAQAQWSLDGIAEVIDFNRKPTNTPDKNIINANMYKSYYLTASNSPFDDFYRT